MGDETRITRAMGKHMDAHSKFLELLQVQARQTEKIEELTEKVERLQIALDNYPATTLSKVDDIREKLSGDEGLRVLVKEQHAHLKTIIRNWQLLAAAAITAMGIISNTLLK